MLYSELISGLWISDIEMLNKTKFLEDNNITIIFNCTQTFDFPGSDSIKKIRLPFSPIRESNTDITLLRNNYKKIVDYISENIDENNILISCYDGKSISPFIVALYIASKSKISKESIYDILLTKNKDLDLWCDISLFVN